LDEIIARFRLNKVDAAEQDWFADMEAGNALVNILFGMFRQVNDRTKKNEEEIEE
jgi:hypothetical protein